MRLQEKIAHSRASLPVMAAYALLVCGACGAVEHRMWAQVLLLFFSTLLVVELERTGMLYRFYSRMASCVFLAMTTMATFLFPSIKGAGVGLSLLAFHLLAFQAYQDNRSVGWLFYAFFALSMGSILFPQLLFFVPLFWLLTATLLSALSWRTLLASLLGLATPYWLMAGYAASQGTLPTLATHFQSLVTFGQPFDFSCLDSHQLATGAGVVLMGMGGAAHFLHTSHRDKVRTRMVYEWFIITLLATIAFALACPEHYDQLLRIATLCAAPLTGRFVALARGRVALVAKSLFLLSLLAITAYNLWMPSFNF